MSSAPSTLEVIVVSKAINDNLTELAAAANDPTIPWEEVSKMASMHNRELLNLMERTEKAVDRLANDAEDQALTTGLRLFSAAAPNVDPEWIPDLSAGVNVMVMRAREAARQGAPLPMNYMDPGVRKMVALVELGLPHIKLEEPETK